MKKWLLFGGGVLTGAVLTFLFFLILGLSQTNNSGVTLFDQPGEVIHENSLKVFQVIDGGNTALTMGKDDYFDIYDGPVYLIVNDEGKYYYDDEIINVPKGKVVRQVGIYKYKTRNDTEKTVPIVKIMNK